LVAIIYSFHLGTRRILKSLGVVSKCLELVRVIAMYSVDLEKSAVM